MCGARTSLCFRREVSEVRARAQRGGRARWYEQRGAYGYEVGVVEGREALARALLGAGGGG